MTDILEKQIFETPEVENIETENVPPLPEARPPKYPPALMSEYRALISKQFSGGLSAQDETRLQEIKAEISAIDLTSPRAYVPEYDLDKIRAGIDRLECEIDALPDK